MDVIKARNKNEGSDILFFSAFLDLQSIRVDAATASKQLIFFNALTNVRITSGKAPVEVAKFGKKMTFFEASELFQNIRKLPTL